MIAALAPASYPSTSAVGVPLGVAQALGLGEGVVVRGAVVGHAGEDVVGRAVDDPHHAADRLADQRLAQRADEGDAPGDGGLEEQVDPRLVGGGEQLGADVGQQLLVGGDDRLPRGRGRR